MLRLLFRWKIVDAVDFDAFCLVCQLPSRVENELANLSRLIVMDFLRIISGAVVILMNAAEIENHRDVVLRKVVMIRTVLKPIGIIWSIEGVIQR